MLGAPGMGQAILDAIQGPGEWSTITDGLHNVHWLTGLSGDCCLFTTKLIALREGEPYLGRIPVDVLAAAAAGDGTLRAPKLSPAEAAAKYD